VKKAEKVHIGTSGWHYEHWKGPFYPEDLASGDMLPFYACYFDTAEINNSFYRLPSISTLRQWKESVPEGFIFSLKGSRFITHMKKLRSPSESVPPLLEAAGELEDSLGPILFQLPPRWHVNAERLDAFIQHLPSAFRYVFEFRDPTWFDSAVYDILAKRGCAFCIYHLAGRLSPKEITAPFVYVRLHGPGDAYEGCYDDAALSGWAGDFSSWLRQDREVFCYFDNDQAGYAVRNALRLNKMISGE
jgi:uncharacterized protein YecE (DUF72 family)